MKKKYYVILESKDSAWLKPIEADGCDDDLQEVTFYAKKDDCSKKEVVAQFQKKNIKGFYEEGSMK